MRSPTWPTSSIGSKMPLRNRLLSPPGLSGKRRKRPERLSPFSLTRRTSSAIRLAATKISSHLAPPDAVRLPVAVVAHRERQHLSG
jgi:hypothetical protein